MDAEARIKELEMIVASLQEQLADLRRVVKTQGQALSILEFERSLKY